VPNLIKQAMITSYSRPIAIINFPPPVAGSRGRVAKAVAHYGSSDRGMVPGGFPPEMWNSHRNFDNGLLVL